MTGNPRVLFWKVGETPESKVIESRAVGSQVVQSLKPPMEIPGFWHQLESDPLKNVFRLHLKPLSTASPANAIIRSVAQVVGRPPLPVVVYALMK